MTSTSNRSLAQPAQVGGAARRGELAGGEPGDRRVTHPSTVAARMAATPGRTLARMVQPSPVAGPPEPLGRLDPAPPGPPPTTVGTLPPPPPPGAPPVQPPGPWPVVGGGHRRAVGRRGHDRPAGRRLAGRPGAAGRRAGPAGLALAGWSPCCSVVPVGLPAALLAFAAAHRPRSGRPGAPGSRRRWPSVALTALRAVPIEQHEFYLAGLTVLCAIGAIVTGAPRPAGPSGRRCCSPLAAGARCCCCPGCGSARSAGSPRPCSPSLAAAAVGWLAAGVLDAGVLAAASGTRAGLGWSLVGGLVGRGRAGAARRRRRAGRARSSPRAGRLPRGWASRWPRCSPPRRTRRPPRRHRSSALAASSARWRSSTRRRPRCSCSAATSRSGRPIAARRRARRRRSLLGVGLRRRCWPAPGRRPRLAGRARRRRCCVVAGARCLPRTRPARPATASGSSSC